MLCIDAWRLKLGALESPLRALGPGESSRALLMAATALEAVDEIFLKNVPETLLDRLFMG
jgi:hypothetical protein